MITKHLHRWSFPALLLLATSLINCSSADAAPLPNKGPGAHAGNPQVMCIDERITVKAKSVSQDKILDSIAKACKLRVYSATPAKTSVLATVDFTDYELADALGELLRGCDYFVVHNERPDNTGFVVSLAQAHSISPSPLVAETAPTVVEEEIAPVTDERQDRVEHLHNQIEMLNERIASGASDRFYEQAIKSKPAEFVQDDRKMLAEYQHELANLGQ